MCDAMPGNTAALNDAQGLCGCRQEQRLLQGLRRRRATPNGRIPRFHLKLAGRAKGEEDPCSLHSLEGLKFKGFHQLSVHSEDVISRRINPDPSFAREIEPEEI